jgi:hypothetical protein
MQASARLPDGNAAETPGDADGAAPFACGTGEALLAGASACPGSGAGKAACAKTCPASTIATAKVDATIRWRSIKGFLRREPWNLKCLPRESVIFDDATQNSPWNEALVSTLRNDADRQK